MTCDAIIACLNADPPILTAVHAVDGNGNDLGVVYVFTETMRQRFAPQVDAFGNEWPPFVGDAA